MEVTHGKWELTYESKVQVLKQRITKLATNEYEISLNHKFALEHNQQEAEKLASALQGVRESMAFHVRQLNELNGETRQQSLDENSSLHNSSE